MFDGERMAQQRLKQSRGSVLVYVIVMMTALTGFASLAVDYARVQLVKTELLRAADAAARAAASQLANGVTATQNAAVTWGGYNLADTTSVVIDPTNDVDFGTWDTSARTFTVLTGAARTSANAVRVTARRTLARGTGVKLWFGQVIGQSSCDTTSSAIAYSGTSRSTALSDSTVLVSPVARSAPTAIAPPPVHTAPVPLAPSASSPPMAG